jgi:hypothetical protein
MAAFLPVSQAFLPAGQFLMTCSGILYSMTAVCGQTFCQFGHPARIAAVAFCLSQTKTPAQSGAVPEAAS